MKCLYKAIVVVLLSISTNYANAACDNTLPLQGARDDVLILVNDNSLDSCEVGRYYAEKRGLGQNNIVHLAVPASYWLNFTEFRNMMDQIIKYMQDNTLKAGAPPAPSCTDGITPYYCQASMDHLRQYTKVRYLVTTRGIPALSPIGGSGLTSASSTTSVDNYLAYWLVRYFPDTNNDGFSDDKVLNFDEREKAFKDGRGMRIVDPAQDGELIVGRIDGVNLDATKALIDRIIDAEKNGIYGKNYGSQFGKLLGRAQWLDYSKGSCYFGFCGGENVYGDTGTSWRYQLGMFGESRQQCIDYLNFSKTNASGKAPQECLVRFSESQPGTINSRTPMVDDALIYLGSLHGQISGAGKFNNLLNWVRDTSCTVKLCENAADPIACRALSTDAFKEINTECVGVADGFMGYNYQSFPVAHMTQWPTGFRGPSGNSGSYRAFPELRTDIGYDDANSLWFRNTDTVANALCYTDADFSSSPATACRNQRRLLMYPKISIASQSVNTVNPQQYRVSFRFRAENVTVGAPVRVKLRVYEPTAKKWVDYLTQTVGSFGTGTTDWTYAEANFQLDPAKHTQADLVFNKIEITISTATYTGDLGVDTFSIKELVSNTELVTNPSFTEGYKEVSGGDHAAVYLSRLNGVAFWGSLSHHESNGHSFSRNPMETILYFLRGLPLGDAVWWGENHNSGIFYGDPIYSPVAVRLDYVNNDFDYVIGTVNLSGSTVNGRDSMLVSTNYVIDYCPGEDFYLCDQASSWVQTGMTGIGGQENMTLGSWDTSALTPGAYTLRLAVTSTNANKGRSQSLYDYYPVTVYNATSDNDGDGLSDENELIYGSDPSNPDTDNDGLTDGDEVNLYSTSPIKSDTDSDGLPDGWEVANGTSATTDDSTDDPDGDGLTNIGEFNAGTLPTIADTDGDGRSDGDEINVSPLTNPLKPDTDGDGLTDGEEVIQFATDPLSNVDTDLDGMSDDWELARGTNPAVKDALVDSDDDGFVNVLEFLYRTLPLDSGSVPVLQTIYVDANNATGVEDGTLTNPYNTLQKGVNAAQSGNIISLASGTYSAVNITKSINIVGPDDQSAIINSSAINLNNMVWGGFSKVTLNLDGLYISNSRNVSINHSKVISGKSSIDGDIWLYSGSNVAFTNNLIESGGNGGEAFWVDDNSHVELVNDTLVGYPIGVRVAKYPSGVSNGTVTIRNTILVNTIDFFGGSGVTSDPGDLSGVMVSYSLISDGQYVGANGNLSGDPLFVDAAAGDYHLQELSPAIDTGDPNDSATLEPAPGNIRINMGVYGNTAEAAIIPVPVITYIHPPSMEGATGSQILLQGKNFCPKACIRTTVRLGSTILTVNWIQDNFMNLNIPEGTTSGPITVSTAGGTTSSSTFTIIPAPAITYVHPPSMEGATGSQILLQGKNFCPKACIRTTVRLGSTILTVNWIQDNFMNLNIPGTTSGPITVSTAGGSMSTSVFTILP